MQFEFATAARIVFGSGVAEQLPGVARKFGPRLLVVTGSSRNRFVVLLDGLREAGLEISLFSVPGEPTLENVREGAALARDSADVIVGLGGGSAIDAAKAIAALAANSGEPLDYLEVIGQGRPLENDPLPWIAVPTTAGTGAEVTRNAVLGSPEHGVKASLRSRRTLAKAALVDPDLTLGLPPEITAYTGLDAFTQLLEPLVSRRANPMTDQFCLEGLRRVRLSLLRAFRQGTDGDARASMSFASLLGGLALANAGLGVMHGFAAPLGGMLHAPHGAIIAALLPHGIEINIQALRSRAPTSDALARYHQAACLLTGDPHARAEDVTAWVAFLCGELGVLGLRALGLDPARIPELVDKAARASSMQANPIPLTREELIAIAERAL
ncbi:MAG TPA: iron-containing alcohol dehydrogenase [Bryobacteraceae bacterium]